MKLRHLSADSFAGFDKKINAFFLVERPAEDGDSRTVAQSKSLPQFLQLAFRNRMEFSSQTLCVHSIEDGCNFFWGHTICYQVFRRTFSVREPPIDPVHGLPFIPFREPIPVQ